MILEYVRTHFEDLGGFIYRFGGWGVRYQVLGSLVGGLGVVAIYRYLNILIVLQPLYSVYSTE